MTHSIITRNRKAQAAKRRIRPIKGPQEMFLASSVDIAFYGGGANGGKTYGLLLEAARHIASRNFTGIIFRRTSPEITLPGGLWATAESFWPHIGLIPRASSSTLDWRHPTSGGVIKFSHLFKVADRYLHKGGQYAFIGFDEITGFEEVQFTYLLSRSRPADGCDVEPYVRVTCNPDYDSWVFVWVSPWVDPEHPLYPTPYGAPLSFRRAEPGYTPPGIEDYIIYRSPVGTRGEQMIWVKPGCPGSKTMTYIPASMADNPHATESYKASVLSLSRVDRIRLMGVHPYCWSVRFKAGEIFSRDDFIILDAEEIAARIRDRVYVQRVRSWDFAATKGGGDWTVGMLVGVTKSGEYSVIDICRGRWSASEIEEYVKACAADDGTEVDIIIEEEKGAAGKNLISLFASVLPEHCVTASSCTGSKIVRSRKASTRVEQRRVSLHHATWNAVFVDEADGFPEAKHDDMVDTFSAAVNYLDESAPADYADQTRVNLSSYFAA